MTDFIKTSSPSFQWLVLHGAYLLLAIFAVYYMYLFRDVNYLA